MKYEIKNYASGAVLFDCEADSMREALVKAVRSGAYLRGAYLSGANLRGAYLSGANLRDADLRDADLRDADLRGADLSGTDLRDADLSGANLRGADLSGADLSGTDLSGTDLRDADLSGANLRGAYPRGAVELPTADPRGYRCFAVWQSSGAWILFAGCRRFTPAEARGHWSNEDYDGDPLIARRYLFALDWWESDAANPYRERATRDLDRPEPPKPGEPNP